MSTAIAWGNATVAFLLELTALAALAWGGWRLGGDGVARVLLAGALPVVAAVLWGLFAAPHATYPSAGGRLAVQVLVLGGAALVLAWAASPRWGAGFAVLVVANLLLAVLLPVAERAPVG
jgi:uncharacterized protein DUF2568